MTASKGMCKVPHMPKSQPLLTTAEAAERLDRSVATVNRWALAGRLPVADQYPGRTGPRRFKRADVERLAEELGR